MARGVAIGLRPIMIILGGLAAGWLLASLSPIGRALEAAWVVEPMLRTLQLTVVGFGVSLIVGGSLGRAARNSPVVDRRVGLAAIPAAALSAPVVLVSLVYWLSLRVDLLPVRSVSFSDDPVGHLHSQIGPVMVIVAVTAVPVASSVRDAAERWQPAPFGHDAAATALASTASWNADSRRLFGLPAGSLMMALLVAEVAYGIPGIFAVAQLWLFQIGSGDLVIFVAVVAAGGALLALMMDLLSRPFARAAAVPRPSEAEVQAILGGAAARPRGAVSRARSVEAGDGSMATRAVIVGAGIVGLVAVAAAIGQLLGEPEHEPTRRRVGILRIGHLFGTDDQGRDVTHLVAHDAWKMLLFALVPALIAALLGTAVAAVARVGDGGAKPIVGALTGALWWPAVLLLFTVRGSELGPVAQPSATFAVLSLSLVPVAARLAVREFAAGALGWGRHSALSWFGLVAGLAWYATQVLVVSGFLAGAGPLDNWGASLVQVSASSNIGVAVGHGLAITLLLLAWSLLAAGSFHLARHRTASALG